MKKTNWNNIIIVVFLAGFIISWLIIENWKISLILATVSSLITFTFNPVRRYMKAFWSVFSLLITLNSFSLNLVINLFDKNGEGKLNADLGNASTVLSISLVLLAALLLVLDFFERNKTPKFKRKESSGMTIENKKNVSKQININKNKGKIDM